MYVYYIATEFIHRETKEANGLAQMAWHFINDSFKSTLCLQYNPATICIGIIALCIKLKQQKSIEFTAPVHKYHASNDKPWYDVLFNINKSTIDIIGNEMSHIIDLVAKNTANGVHALMPMLPQQLLATTNKLNIDTTINNNSNTITPNIITPQKPVVLTHSALSQHDKQYESISRTAIITPHNNQIQQSSIQQTTILNDLPINPAIKRHRASIITAPTNTTHNHNSVQQTHIITPPKQIDNFTQFNPVPMKHKFHTNFDIDKQSSTSDKLISSHKPQVTYHRYSSQHGRPHKPRRHSENDHRLQRQSSNKSIDSTMSYDMHQLDKMMEETSNTSDVTSEHSYSHSQYSDHRPQHINTIVYNDITPSIHSISPTNDAYIDNEHITALHNQHTKYSNDYTEEYKDEKMIDQSIHNNIIQHEDKLLI